MIAILVGVIIVAYNGWSEDTNQTVINSDLTAASAAMKDAANFSNTYPAAVPSSFTPSDKVTMVGGGISGQNDFCVSATRQGVSYFMTKQGIALPGTCPQVYYSASYSQSYASGATQIKDLSGNGNTASLKSGATIGAIGPVQTSDAGGVFTIQPGNSYATDATAFSFGPNSTWTICAKTTASSSSHNMFMGRHLPYFGSYSNGTGVVFSNIIGGTQRTIISTSPVLPLNTWYCYGFTTSYDGTNTTMSVYIDGTLRSSATYPGAQSNPSYRFTVGDGNTFTASPYQWLPFTGQLSDVAVYPRTLTASELKEITSFQRKKLGL